MSLKLSKGRCLTLVWSSWSLGNTAFPGKLQIANKCHEEFKQSLEKSSPRKPFHLCSSVTLSPLMMTVPCLNPNLLQTLVICDRASGEFFLAFTNTRSEERLRTFYPVGQISVFQSFVFVLLHQFDSLWIVKVIYTVLGLLCIALSRLTAKSTS